jgi:acetyltransferase-like isoleucine patch superfamily enzyme
MLNKIKNFIFTMSLLDVLRKFFFVLSRTSIFSFLKKVKGIYYFKSKSIKLGERISVSGQAFNIRIGNNVTLYPDTKFEFSNKSVFEVGDNCVFSYGVLIACSDKIIIGKDVQIGEYTSIRDSTHDYVDTGKPMKINKDISESIVIGNNVWIGRNCLISPGSVIEDGVVIGANSLVKGTLKSNLIYAGNPIRVIKPRPRLI